MRLRTIREANVENKRVFLRVDFNVSIKDGYIEDDFRIKAVLETIDHLLEKKAKIIIAAHLGRPKGKDEKLSLKMIAKRLEGLAGVEVGFVSDCIGEKVKDAVSKLEPGEILMLENLRFYNGEEDDSDDFASELASLADIYVNDAFAVAHRAHASVSAIAKFLPAYAGFLMEKEYNTLNSVYHNPKKPLVIAMGGAKVMTKVKLIKRFLDKADHILVGGVIANVILDAKGVAIGKSKLDKDVAGDLASLDLTSPKLHLPIDLVVAKEISEDAETKVVATGAVLPDDIILDIGPSSVDLFYSIVRDANMVIWNGPLGYSEITRFAKGTDDFADAVCKSAAYRIVGGGESITSLDKIGDLEKIDFVSTGGGSMLEFLAGDPMPGINPLLTS
ncbi:phosphoglycerate kinase [Candidatus Azambacteria bacterium]|nr:phosphoglycerate kinase [Candidatus Azambacteria bacterium]